MASLRDRVLARFGLQTVKAAPKRSRRSHFQAANISRLTNSWVTAPIRQDFAVRQELSVLRARSREMIRNNEYARRVQQMLADNVVGPDGITLRSLIRDANGKNNKALSDQVEYAWSDWARAGHCDIKRKLTWIDFQRIVVMSRFTDGESFIRIHEGSWAGEPYRFALELIDAERVPVNLKQVLQAGYYIRGGIEYDSLARPVAYYVRVDNDSNAIYYSGQAYSRIPASQIIHAFRPEFADQTRGYPEMASGMMSLFHLGGYKEAAVMAARAGAAKMGFFSNPDGEEIPADDLEEDGTPILDFDPMTLHDIGNMQFTGFDPKYPDGDFGPFVKTCLQAFASSQNISYNTLANDLEGVTYSSLKTGKDDERNGYECQQRWLVDKLCQPVFERWIARQLISGKLTNGDVSDPFNPSPLTSVKWQPHRWPEIDPLKSASADSVRIKDRVTSRTEVIRRRSRDEDEVWREIADESDALADVKPIPEATADATQSVQAKSDDLPEE